MYKALITDLDGTVVALASNGSDIDEQTVNAVTSTVAAGKLIACATGRDWAEAKPVIQRLGLVAPCIIEGGTRIVEPLSENTVWEKSLEAGGAERVLSVLHAITSTGVLMHSAASAQIPLASQLTLSGDLRYIYLLGVSEEIAERICNQINFEEDGSEVAHITPSWSGAGLVDVHVTHREATKEHAITVWQQLYGVGPAETIGLGDSGNDLPIFESCGLKIAVQNATLPLKELADIIAPRYDQHALSFVLEKYLSA